jgi:hypothetical protein
MFNTITNTAIDTIQAGKKQIVNTVVKHEGLAESINKFVDAETAYTKAFIENISGLASNFQTVFTSKESSILLRDSLVKDLLIVTQVN